MVDRDRNGFFNGEKDILTITTPDNPYVPVYKDFNPNVTTYFKNIIISYQGELLQVENVSADGESVQLKYISNSKKNED